jgi:hypothetical protein
MAAHSQETTVELAVLANEHGLDRRLHVVVDAARAGPLKKAKARLCASNTISWVSRG